jgi:hypothetical protein
MFDLGVLLGWCADDGAASFLGAATFVTPTRSCFAVFTIPSEDGCILMSVLSRHTRHVAYTTVLMGMCWCWKREFCVCACLHKDSI